jgi:hypothetical protein
VELKQGGNVLIIDLEVNRGYLGKRAPAEEELKRQLVPLLEEITAQGVDVLGIFTTNVYIFSEETGREYTEPRLVILANKS